MIYVTSDLHGYPLDRFLSLLDSVSFSDNDFLFVLGDVIDRNGDGGVSLLSWMMLQSNVELILGNHEAMLLTCDFLFREITEDGLSHLNAERIGAMSEWMYNGANPTLTSLRELHKKDPDALYDLLDYIKEAPLYETVTAGGRDFLLVHAGLGHFSPDKPLSSYDPNDLLWYRPEAEERFFTEAITILGHTPTVYYDSPDRMFVTPTWIDIDTGAADGHAPMLLRLDDLKAFYAPPQNRLDT